MNKTIMYALTPVGLALFAVGHFYPAFSGRELMYGGANLAFALGFTPLAGSFWRAVKGLLGLVATSVGIGKLFLLAYVIEPTAAGIDMIATGSCLLWLLSGAVFISRAILDYGTSEGEKYEY